VKYNDILKVKTDLVQSGNYVTSISSAVL